MEFYEALKKRHSVRSYTDAPVEKEKLDRVLNAAVTAPTAKNLQAFRVFVIPTKGRAEDFKKFYAGAWMSEPPYVLLVCTEKDRQWVRRDGKPYGDVDSAIIMDHIIMAATAEGLGTCWIGAFNAEAAIEVLGLPANLEPIVFTPLGYEAGEGQPRPKLGVLELVKYM
jgi:nitroreductase